MSRITFGTADAEAGTKTDVGIEPSLVERRDSDERGAGAVPLGEAAAMLWTYPDFTLMIVICVGSAVSWLIPQIYVLAPLVSQIWVAEASWFVSMQYALAALIGMLGCTHFGRWSDEGNRRSSVLVVLLSTLISPLAPLLLFGESTTTLWVCFGLHVSMSPFRPTLSGSPILMAALSETVPERLKSVGFGISMALPSLFIFLTGMMGDVLHRKFGMPNFGFVWIGVGAWIISLLAFFSASFAPAPASDTDAGPKASSLRRSLIEPFFFMWSTRLLRAVSAIALLLTLGDVIATSISSQVLFEIVGIAGYGHQREQQEAVNYFHNWCNVLLVPFCLLVVSLGSRCGGIETLCLLLPMVSLGFAAPSLLKLGHSPLTYVAAGFCMDAPLALYPLLHALVTQLVPADRIAEALGGITACKAFASVIAPILTASATRVIADRGLHELYLTIFPAGALIMLTAWPFAIYTRQLLKSESGLTSPSFALKEKMPATEDAAETQKLLDGGKMGNHYGS